MLASDRIGIQKILTYKDQNILCYISSCNLSECECNSNCEEYERCNVPGIPNYDNTKTDNVCEDVCSGITCVDATNGNCIGRNHKWVCECKKGYSGDANKVGGCIEGKNK